MTSKLKKIGLLYRVFQAWEHAEKEIMQVLPDKALNKSMTIWGTVLLALYALLESLQGQLTGWLGPIWGPIVPAVISILGVILTGLGLRRAVGTNGTPKV